MDVSTLLPCSIYPRIVMSELHVDCWLPEATISPALHSAVLWSGQYWQLICSHYMTIATYWTINISQYGSCVIFAADRDPCFRCWLPVINIQYMHVRGSLIQQYAREISLHSKHLSIEANIISTPSITPLHRQLSIHPVGSRITCGPIYMTMTNIPATNPL
jgi:hypothetical protein